MVSPTNYDNHNHRTSMHSHTTKPSQMPVFHLLYPFLDDNTTKQTFPFEMTQWTTSEQDSSVYHNSISIMFCTFFHNTHMHACLHLFPSYWRLKHQLPAPKILLMKTIDRGLLRIKTLEPTKYFHARFNSSFMSFMHASLYNLTYCLQSPVSSRSTSPSHHIPSTFLHTHHVTLDW